MLQLQLKKLGLESYYKGLHPDAEERTFNTDICLNTKVHKVGITVYLNGEGDPTSLGLIFKNCILDLDKSYNAIISMGNKYLKDELAKYGSGIFDNEDHLDCAKGFNLNKIFIFTKPVVQYHPITNQKYLTDTTVWFFCDNEHGRGMDAYFYKGKLVSVETTP